MKVLIPVALGELYDKLSILELKRKHLKSPDLLAKVEAERTLLLEVIALAKLPEKPEDYESLAKVNALLWDIEDQIRVCERLKDFGPAFVALARQVYTQNDLRFRLKSLINQKLGSEVEEVKSYEAYD